MLEDQNCEGRGRDFFKSLPYLFLADSFFGMSRTIYQVLETQFQEGIIKRKALDNFGGKAITNF